MNFTSDKPIYRQIIDYSFNCILSGQWLPDMKVPSVRELSLQLTVNTHTVLKAFDYLQNHGIIIPRRGMGYYLAPDAPQRVEAARKEDFFESVLPALFNEMDILGISIDEIAEHYAKHVKK